MLHYKHYEMSSVSTIENRYRHSRFAWLIYILIIKAIVACIMIAAFDIHLSPDEAQYWTWSQKLDWGYYSKPPAIAWQIWTTTMIFGNTEFGIRFGAVIISFFLALVVFHLSHSAKLTEKVSFWAAIVMAFCPLGIFLTFAATTDGGSTLFLTLGIAEIVKGMHEKRGPNYALAGVWIFLGALYKWTAFIIWPVTIIMIFFHPKLRRWSLFWGILISLLALLPSIYWNATHDWATFKHVGQTIYHTGAKTGGNIVDFFFAQVGIISPIYFILLVASYFYIRKPTLVYCGLFPLLILIYFVSAFFKRMQPNWGDFLYPTGCVLIAWVALEKIRLGRIWLHIGTWLSVIGTFFALTIPWMQGHSVFSTHPITYNANPFRQSMGWDKIETALVQAGYNSAENFLFADRYQAASLLSFYGPEQKGAYFFNVNQERKNQFSYNPRMENLEKGHTGYFVLFENIPYGYVNWYEENYPRKLAPYFETVEFAGAYPLFSAYGEGVKHAMIFKCSNYLGTSKQDPELY